MSQVKNQPLYSSHRATGNPSATVASGGTVSSAVDIGLYGVGAMYLPAEFNGDTISFQGSNAVDGTFTAIRTTSGAVSFTAHSAAAWYELPSSVMCYAFIKVVTSVATGGAATIDFSLKS